MFGQDKMSWAQNLAGIVNLNSSYIFENEHKQACNVETTSKHNIWQSIGDLEILKKIGFVC